MDTEKIKQMGRDYFKANPERLPSYLDDKAFTELCQSHDSLREDLQASLLWNEGYNEACYAASKESRAIELLGKLVTEVWASENNEAWHQASAFLQEIGWKPKP